MDKIPGRIPKICGVVTAQDADSALKLLREHAAFLDCAELRLDFLRQPDEAGLKFILEQSPVPIIVTFRPERHGGCYQGEEDFRLRMLRKAVQSGAFAVDLEEDVDPRFFAELNAQGASIIASYHNFDRTPDSIPSIYEMLRGKTSFCVKIATMVQSMQDLLRLHSLQSLPGLKIIVGMGETGLITRVLSSRFGSMLTFGLLEKGKPTAPGQIHVQDMVKLYRFREISDETRVYGVLGWPIAQSLSPLVHNVCFADAGWDGVYIALGSPNLDGMRELAEVLGFRGFSVTHPHKQRTAYFCDQMDASVSRAGASNTIVVTDGNWEAWNTDVTGFLRPLQKRQLGRGTRAIVYGSGGAATAAIAGLSELRAHVTIVSRNREKGEGLARQWGCTYLTPGSEMDRGAELLINATPLGMLPNPDEKPCDLRSFCQGKSDQKITIYDMVYNPKETLWIREANHLGLDVIYGQEMFIEQAAEQFRLWTRREMNRDLAFQVVDAALQNHRPV